MPDRPRTSYENDWQRAADSDDATSKLLRAGKTEWRGNDGGDVSAQAGVSGTGSIIQSAWEAVVVSERFIRGAPDELISNIDHDPMLLQDAFAFPSN